MAHFKIGDRVRIKAPCNLGGCTGTIWDIRHPPPFWLRWLEGRGHKWGDDALDKGVHPKETAYLVDIDGHGRYSGFSFGVFGYPYYWLEPLTPPAADAWAESKVRQVTRPLHTEPVAPKVSEPHNQGSGQ